MPTANRNTQRTRKTRDLPKSVKKPKVTVEPDLDGSASPDAHNPAQKSAIRKQGGLAAHVASALAVEAATGDILAYSEINKHIEIVGLHVSVDGSRFVVIGRPGAPHSKALHVPLSLLAGGRQAQLQALLLDSEHMHLATQFSPKEIASALLEAARTSTVRVVDREGLQELEIDGSTHRGIVKGGKCHWLSGEPDGAEVVLVGAAAGRPKPEHSLAHFNQHMAAILAALPRVLVVLCFALAAIFFRAFGRPPTNVATVGRSSTGKSIVQQVTVCLVNGSDQVLTMNTTVIGLHDYMAQHPDEAVYFEDAHGGHAAAAITAAIMDVGNAAARLRSDHGTAGHSRSQVHCTLILSAERGVAATARSSRQPVNSGVFARIIEVHQGEHGMFDSLCGFPDAATLAKHLKTEAPGYRGLIGDGLVKEIAEHWGQVQNLWRKKEVEIRTRLLKEAGIDSVDGINGRLLDGLTFVAFVGCLLVHFKLVDIKRRDVYGAFGMVFREHLDRLKASSSPVAEGVIEAVRHYIQTNPGRFLPLVQAGDVTKPNGLAGYLKRGKSGQATYLFFPGVFRENFITEFGDEAYSHLREAGYLEVQASRGNLISVRIPAGGGDGTAAGRTAPRQDFVGIREAILYSDDDE